MVVTVFNCFKPHSIIWPTIAFISHERKLKIVSTDVVKKEPSEVFPEIALRSEFLHVLRSRKNLDNNNTGHLD